MKTLKTELQLAALLTLALLACTAAFGQITPSQDATTTAPVHSRLGRLMSRINAQPTGAANHQAQMQTPGSADLTFTFGMIDFPGQPASDASGINDKGEIVGGYGSAFDSAFLLKGTKFTEIAYPGAAWTDAYAINDAGVIVGGYGTSLTDAQGFELTGKTYSAINYPGAAQTAANGIDKQGNIVGAWSASGTTHGFLLWKGVFTSIDVPGAVETSANGINSAGVIVGDYENSDGSYHGFLLQSGTFTTIDYPGGYSQNFLMAINDSGLIVGGYGGEYCFVYQNSQFTSFVAPFGPPAVTLVYGINNKGDIAGAYQDSSGTWYGYEATIAQ